MSTQYTPRAGLPFPQLDDPNWHLPIQASLEQLDAQAALGPFSVRPTAPGAAAALPSTSLEVQVAAGSFLNATGTQVDYPGTASIALPPSTQTRLWLDDSGSLNSGASYPAGSQILPLATATTSATGLTSLTDDRIVWRSFGGSSAGCVERAGDTLADGSNYTLGTTSGTRLGTASTQKLGFLGALPVDQRPSNADIRQTLIDFGLLASGGPTPLDLNGGTLLGNVRLPVTLATGSLALAELGVVLVSAAANLTLTLPDAASLSGGLLILKRIDATSAEVSVSRAGADTIDGLTLNTSLNAPYACLRLVATPGLWVVV